ncbi:hypothetical protein [Thermococcus sp. JCM 11816]|uniref:hypothetical protein n=1 Tax=Thermococcus sp. (strain JCM 11816 / KS-1) TaxID=1295125 RepID=UPI000AA4FED5
MSPRPPQEFLEELFSKVEGNPKEKVKVYSILPLKKTIETKRKTLEYEISEDKKIVERFLEYLFSKLNASYSHSDALAKVYNAYTRKGGRATLKVVIREGEKTHVSIEVEGFGGEPLIFWPIELTRS